MKLSYLYKNLIIVLRSKEKLMARKPPEASKITLVELLGRKRCRGGSRGRQISRATEVKITHLKKFDPTFTSNYSGKQIELIKVRIVVQLNGSCCGKASAKLILVTDSGRTHES